MPIVNFKTLKSFAQFLWNFKLSGSPLVDQNTANLRAEICAGCHNNISSKDVPKGRGCAVCNKLGNKALNQLREPIIGKNKTSKDAKLLTCGICGCDLALSVWIPNNILLDKEDANAYPSFCWKKKILEDQNL